MLSLIRKFVYKMGFRPAYGTVLYSPSLAWTIGGQQAAAAFMDAYGKMAEDFSSGLLRAQDTPTFVEKVEEEPVDRRSLYERIKHCLFCGAEMVDFVADIKECPNLCSRAHPTENWEGMPTVTVEWLGRD